MPEKEASSAASAEEAKVGPSFPPPFSSFFQPLFLLTTGDVVIDLRSHSCSHQPTQPDVAVGMKLEAVDRKNPHLVCVATLAEIDEARDDCWRIHFDGWTEQCVAARLAPACSVGFLLTISASPLTPCLFFFP